MFRIFVNYWLLNIKKNKMDIQAQKEIVSKQFKQVNDINLINAIKSILDYAIGLEKNDYAIPEAQQQRWWNGMKVYVKILKGL